MHRPVVVRKPSGQWLAVLAAVWLLGGSALSARIAPADSLKVQRLARQFSAAFMRGDAVAMANLYTSDGVIFPEQSEWISGREAIQRYFTPNPGRRITHHLLTPNRIVVDGQHAYDYGTYGGRSLFTGSYARAYAV